MALVEEVVQEYKTSLLDLNVNSKPLINMLTMLADDNEQHAPHIVKVIEDHITKVDERTRSSMYKLRQTWAAIVPLQKLYMIDVQINNLMDPAWPITAPPPEQTSIHVNPKFLAKASDGEHSSPETVIEDEDVQEDEDVPEPEEDLDEQEKILRQQLIAKQQELLKIKQASLELELAETEEKMRLKKKQSTKSSSVPTGKTGPKAQVSPKSAVEVPVAPRDPRLAASTLASRDPRLARSAHSTINTPLSNTPVNSSLSAFPSSLSTSTTHTEHVQEGFGSPPNTFQMSQYNSIPMHPGNNVPFVGQGDIFTGEVYNSPEIETFAMFSEDDSESSVSSWQEVVNIPPPQSKKQSVINTRDPRYKKRGPEESHKGPQAAHHHRSETSRQYHHNNSSKQHSASSKHHSEPHKHHAEISKSHHTNTGHPDPRSHRHSSENKERERNSKERDRNSKERDRVSKEKDMVSTRNSSSHSSSHKSTSSQSISKPRGSSKDKDVKSAESVRERDSRHKMSVVSDKKKTHDSNSRSSSSSKLSPKSDSNEKSKTSRSPEIKAEKSPRKSSSSTSQRSEKDSSKDKKGKRSEDSKKKDSKSALKDNVKLDVEQTRIKKEPNEVKRIEMEVDTKEEKMDTDELTSPHMHGDKGAKRASEKGTTPRAIKKLKMEPGLENDNNNSINDTAVKMETSDRRESVSNDISDLFGCEDQDYRSAEQKALPLKSPSSKGWDSFKAQHSDTFAHDIQLKKQREELEQKKRDDEPQDTDYRLPTRRQSSASDEALQTRRQSSASDEALQTRRQSSASDEALQTRRQSSASEEPPISELIQDQHAEILLTAHKQLQDGVITHEQHQEILKGLGELMHIQKLQRESELRALGQDLAAVDKPPIDNDSDLRNRPEEEQTGPREELPPDRPLERFKIPRLREREGSPRKGLADARGELQNLYPDRPVQEPEPLRPDPRERKGPLRLDRGEPVEVEKDWQPVSPDKARQGESGRRGQSTGVDRREELDRRGPQGENRRGPQAETSLSVPHKELGRRNRPGENIRRGPPGEFEGRGPPGRYDRRVPTGPSREPDRKGQPDFINRRPPGEGRRGRSLEFDAHVPPVEAEKWTSPREEFSEERPISEDITRRGPPNRRGPPGDLNRRGPLPVEAEKWTSPREEFSEERPVSEDITRRGPPNRRGPPGDLNRRGPPPVEAEKWTSPREEFSEERPVSEDITRRGPPNRRGPPGDLNRRGPPPAEAEKWTSPREEFSEERPVSEDITRRGPPNRRGPPGDLNRRGPPGDYAGRVPQEEFDRRGPPAGPHSGPQGRFHRDPREFEHLPEGHQHQRDQVPPNEFTKVPPDWVIDGEPQAEDMWCDPNTGEPHGKVMRHRDHLEEENWTGSPREDFSHGPDDGRPHHRPGPPQRNTGPRGPLIQPMKGPGPFGPRGLHQEQFMGPHGSPFAEFPDEQKEIIEQKLGNNSHIPKENNSEKPLFDPDRGLPPWQPVKRQGPPIDEGPPGNWKKRNEGRSEELGPPGPPGHWKKRNEGRSEEQGPPGPPGHWKKRNEGRSEEQGPPWENVKVETEPYENGPPFHDQPGFDGPRPMHEGPGPFTGPPSSGPPRFAGPPRGGPSRIRAPGPPEQQGPAPSHGPHEPLGPHGRPGPPVLGPDDVPPIPDQERSPHLQGAPVPQPVHTRDDKENVPRSHTEHLPPFPRPANPKPAGHYREEQHAQIQGKRFSNPRHERPRLPGPIQSSGPSMPRPLLDPGLMSHGGRPRGPVFNERQNMPRGPHPPVEAYVDKNGDPRFRSFVDIGPEVSEEVVLGKRNYEIKLGAPPRRIQWGTENIEVYADPSKRGVVVDGVLMYKFGERVKEVVIRGRKEKIFYHGKPLTLWIDGQSYEVRVDSPPKAIFINSKPHRVQIDGRDMMILIDKEEKGKFGGEPRFVFIDGERMEVRFDPPPGHILIDGKPCELKLNLPQPCVNIDGKLHGIRFDGPPRDVFINGNLYKIHTDHAIKLRVGNRFHYVALGGPCHELIVDGKWFELKFNNPPKEISIGNTILNVQLPGAPPEVKILPELPPPLNMPMPGPNLLPVSMPMPGIMPPQSMPVTMVPVPTVPIPGNMAIPGLAVPVSNQPGPLPSSLSNLFTSGPAPSQPAVAAPVDINSLLARLKSSGILPKDQTPPSTKAPRPTAADKRKEKEKNTEPVLSQEFATIKKKNESKEEKFDDIPDMTELEINDMKIMPIGSIQRMYAGVQCNSCGTRFRLDDEDKTEKYRQHLDWHFRQNKRDMNDIRVVRCRKWYYGISDWLQYEEIGDTEEQAKSSLFEMQQQQQQVSSSPSQPHLPLFTVPEGSSVLKCPPATGNENDDLCDICHEPFEQYWDEEHEQWHLRDAIQVNSKNYHPICYEDYTDVSEGTPSPSVLNSMEPNFSGRKTNYDECSQDGLPHSSFEEERGTVSVEITKTEAPTTSKSDTGVVVKLEPMFESVKNAEGDKEAMDVDQVPAVDSADTVETEPVSVDPSESVSASFSTSSDSVAVKAEPIEAEAEPEIKEEPADSGPVAEFPITMEASSSYESTGVLPGLDIKPDPEIKTEPDLVEPVTNPVIEPEIEQESDHLLELEMEIKEAEPEYANEVKQEPDLPQIETTEVKEEAETEEQSAVLTEAIVKVKNESVVNPKALTQNVESTVKEEINQGAEELENVPQPENIPDVSLFTPLTTLSRVKLCAPSNITEVSPDVLDIGSNASTPTRDELPSPPAEDY